MDSILSCFSGKTQLNDQPVSAPPRIQPHQVEAELTLGDYTARSFGSYIFIPQGRVNFSQPCVLKVLAGHQLLGEVSFTTTIQSLIQPVPLWNNLSVYHQVKAGVTATRFESFDSTLPNRGVLIGVTVQHADFGTREFVFAITPKS